MMDSGTTHFTLQPANKTVNYGDFVNFECHAHPDHQMHTISLYIGRIVLIDSNYRYQYFNNLDQRDFSANINGTVGSFWILVNNRTLLYYEYFWCRIDYNGTHVDSDDAYINVKYPECTSQLKSQGQCIQLQPTSTQAHHLTSTVFVQDCQPTCTCDLTGSNQPGM